MSCVPFFRHPFSGMITGAVKEELEGLLQLTVHDAGGQPRSALS